MKVFLLPLFLSCAFASMDFSVKVDSGLNHAEFTAGGKASSLEEFSRMASELASVNVEDALIKAMEKAVNNKTPPHLSHEINERLSHSSVDGVFQGNYEKKVVLHLPAEMNMKQRQEFLKKLAEIIKFKDPEALVKAATEAHLLDEKPSK